MVRLGLGWGRVRGVRSGLRLGWVGVRARVGASGGVRDKGWEIVRVEVRVRSGVAEG